MKRTLLLNPSLFIFIFICLIVSNYFVKQFTTLFQFNFEGNYTPNINNTIGTPSVGQLVLIHSSLKIIHVVLANSNSLAGSGWNGVTSL
jgi:hypothetical protein